MNAKNAILSTLFLAFVLGGSTALAQPSAEDRARAADAYDHGVAAFRAGDYVEAATLFERANSLFPSPAAVVQAIRSHRNIRNSRQAGSLALQLEGEPGLSAQANATVRQALAAARPRYARVEVLCNADCQLTVDGDEQDYPRFFIEPNVEVEIVAVFATGTRTQRVSGRAGGSQTVNFEAPAGSADVPSPATVAAAEETQDLAIEETSNPYRISRLRFLSRPRATFFVVGASALTIGGITLWSAVDSRASYDTYRQAVDLGATPEDIAVRRSQHRQDVVRTRGYIGFSAVMLALSGGVAAFTDWTPNEDDTRADVEILPGGAAATVTHRF